MVKKHFKSNTLEKTLRNTKTDLVCHDLIHSFVTLYNLFPTKVNLENEGMIIGNGA